MAELPIGTVTFLFTDIQGSTRLWEQHPQAMRAAVARHDALLRDICTAHGGYIFGTAGDSFCVAFERAPDALAAALDSQRALQTEVWGEISPLRVRIALHTGTAEFRDGDYFGAPLNRVARLLAAGHGGQVLLTAAAQELVQDELPTGVSLRDLGLHRLRDLQRPDHLFQLLHPQLPANFPPLVSLDALPNNLPLQVTSFVGREKEMAEVKRLLGTTRLLTLTGTGGTGKTRLALQVAADLLQEYPDGVWLAELAALVDPALVPQAVASVLGVREEPGKPIAQTLVEALKSKRLLLLLDNCEHVLAVGAELADALLRGCPSVQVLTTSREGLKIAGEQAYRVPSLSLPDPHNLPPLEQLQEFEAVRLFAERAVLGQPSFAVTSANAAPVVQVCHRLDGIPLAIELAAARAKVLPAEKIAERLDDRFRLLTGGSRTALPRQQTLRALIDWSYDLLSEPERALLRRLSVFAGGWTLEAAEAVCAGESIEEWDVLDLLTSLVEKSLVIYEQRISEGRYRLLETVRQYGWERLDAAGEANHLRERLLAFCLGLAEGAEPHLRSMDSVAWLDRLEAEHDNLRAALLWSTEKGEVEKGFRLGGALRGFWGSRGHYQEGIDWLTELLALAAPTVGLAARAKVLYGAGELKWRQGENTPAAMLLEESLALYRKLDDKTGIGFAALTLGFVTQRLGDYERAAALCEESLIVRSELGDQWGVGWALMGVGHGAAYQGDYLRATALYEESLALFRGVDYKAGIGWSLLRLAGIARIQGNHERVTTLCEESVALFRHVGERTGTADSLYRLGEVARHRGQYAEARRLHEESLTLFWKLGSRRGIAECLQGLTALAIGRGRPERAARLSGAEEGLPKGFDWRVYPASRAEHARHVAAVRAALGEEAFAAAWAEGRAMSLEEAIRYALEAEAPQGTENKSTR